MQFGKIEYLNLLPFHLFMKRHFRSSRSYMSFRYHKGVPSKINADYKARRVDAAFISSIKAQKERYVDLGIIAKKEVLSVLVLPNDTYKADSESATSNVLAKILNVQGEVIIGDKALRHYLQGDDQAIDLAALWNQNYKLPFVFALLCSHRYQSELTKMAKAFSRQEPKIPQYLLHKAAQRTGISPQEIKHYLSFISYTLDAKAKAGLKKFWHLSHQYR